MFEQFSTALTNTLTFSVVQDLKDDPTKYGDASYFDVKINNLLGTSVFAGLVFDGNCVDVDRPISLNKNYTSKVFSSYDLEGLKSLGLIEQDLQGKTGWFEKPENFDLLNWVINQKFEGRKASNGQTFTAGDVQRAVWTLIDDENSTGGVGTYNDVRVLEIVNLAKANGENFVPTYNYTNYFEEQVVGKLAVFLIPNSLVNQFVMAEVPLSQLGDKVWSDINADGIQDLGEEGISGVTVNLLADKNHDGVTQNDEIIGTTTTDATGNYNFSVIAGDYKVQFVQPDGYQTSPIDVNNNNNDSVDSDGLNSKVITIKAGESNPTIDSGFYKLASLGDYVFEDLNADGIQNANESGIANTTVNLINPSTGAIIATTTTNADGLYSFAQLTPSDYKVEFVTPNGYTQVSPANVGGDDAVDSDGAMVITNLSAGENDTTIDSGFYKLASLGDYVFADNNNNGIQDEGDTALGGVTVELIQNGQVITTTTTNPDGSYKFEGLIPGDYQVQFTSPDGYIFSTSNLGDDSLDSDADATGLTQTVTLTSGEFNSTLDAGLVKLASLGDLVFEDVNANGIQDENESGIANTTVNLINPTTNAIIATTSTDADGLYSFRELTPGDYNVEFVTPNGYTQVSAANVGSDDAVDSDGAMVTTNLSAGEDDTTIDSGFYKLASLGDYVFVDNNNNGTQDAGDTAIAGVAVQLIQNNQVVKTITTDANGAYLFEGLTPGDYQVQFTSPTDYTFTTANVGDDSLDNDADATGLTQTVTLTSGEFNSTLDAGLIKLASLGDFVWHDLNADGIQQANEQGIANATVNLINPTTNGIIGSTTTNASGLYSFTQLIPGDYKVEFVTPHGYTQVSAANVGGDDAVDSDGTTVITNLSAGENDLTIDSGFYKLASLGDYVFADNNKNGTQDAGDTAIAGVTVQLIQNNQVLTTTTTNANGAYLFSGLTPGDYQVKFTTPTGYTFAAANLGNDSLDSDANTTTGLTQTVTLTSGEFNSTLDAGLVTTVRFTAPGAGTPGFWHGNGSVFWDGIVANESKAGQSGFANGELLAKPYSNPTGGLGTSASPFQVLDPITGTNKTGLLIGDFNRNGVTDNGEDTLFFSRQDALTIVNASNHRSTSLLSGNKNALMLGRDLVANWLNFLSGNSFDLANGSTSIRNYVGQGVDVLQAFKITGAIDGNTYSTLHTILDNYNNGSAAYATGNFHRN